MIPLVDSIGTMDAAVRAMEKEIQGSETEELEVQG
jgi:hypothetical protein